MVRRKLVPARSDASTASTASTSKTVVLVPKNPRKRAATRVMEQIKYLRRTVGLAIPEAPFFRLVKDIIKELFPRSEVTKIGRRAVEALHESTEAYLVQFFEDCALVVQHAKRVTLQRPDMVLVRRLRGRDDIINR